MNHLIQVPHKMNGNAIYCQKMCRLLKVMVFTEVEIAIWWLCKSFIWFLVWGQKGSLWCDMAAVSCTISLIVQL